MKAGVLSCSGNVKYTKQHNTIYNTICSTVEYNKMHNIIQELNGKAVVQNKKIKNRNKSTNKKINKLKIIMQSLYERKKNANYFDKLNKTVQDK